MTSEQDAVALSEAEIRRIDTEGLGDTEVYAVPIALITVFESILADRVRAARAAELREAAWAIPEASKTGPDIDLGTAGAADVANWLHNRAAAIERGEA